MVGAALRWVYAAGTLLASVACGGGGSSGAPGDASPGEPGTDDGGVAVQIPGDGSAPQLDLDAPSGLGPGPMMPDVGIGTSYCSMLSPKPTFCSDFDEGPLSVLLWTVDTHNFIGGTPDSGVVALDTATYLSAPASLDMRTRPAGDGGDEPRAFVEKALATSGSDVTFGFDVLLAPGTTSAIAEISFVHATGSVDEIDLAFVGAMPAVQQAIPWGDAGGVNYVGFQPFGDAAVPAGSWHRLELEVLVGPPPTVSARMDGATLVDHAMLDPRFSNGTVSALVGVEVRGPAAAQEMHLDNVVIDVKP